MKKFLSKKTVIIGLIVVVIVVVFASGSGEDAGPVYDTIVIERGAVVQEISTTGRVEALESVDLAFELSGRVDAVKIEVGDMVSRGDVLVALADDAVSAELLQARASIESAEATLRQYEASLASQQAKLAELLAGTRKEEILLYESKVQNSEIALTSARETMLDVMQDAYTRAEDAVRVKADQLFNDPKTLTPDLKFTTKDYSLRNSINASRVELENMLIEWNNTIDSLTLPSDLDPGINTTKLNLERVKLFLEQIATALNDSLASQYVPQATIDLWKVDISGARTSINLAISNHSSAKASLRAAEVALLIAQNELDIKNSGANPEQIIAQQALVQQAEASVASQKAQIKLVKSAMDSVFTRLYKHVLNSPIDGIITRQSAKVGAIVSANQNIVTVISEGGFEIEALVVEADIINLSIGDRARMSLDAYSGDVIFDAEVVDIDPAAELIEGVANYRVTLVLDTEDERIRPGMTADIDVVTAKKENAISIPQRAVIIRGDSRIVRVLKAGVVTELQVETGITGERGQIEIVRGLSVGDVVVTAIK